MNGSARRLPYPGLRSFDREEADLFFGRDDSVDDMVDKLAATRFLAVIGASGSGKSSLVRTGLLDALDLGLHPLGSGWLVGDFSPAGRPLARLATALVALQGDSGGGDIDARRLVVEHLLRQGPRSLIQWVGDGYLPPDTHLLLLVDQFEELFRYTDYTEREEAEAFVNLLIESSRSAEASIHVVVTMRSEFLGACALLPGLAEIINDGAYLTPRMSRDGCREAIVGPARIVGAEVESSLVGRMLNDLASFAPWDSSGEANALRSTARRADQLPMMQHVLNRMWRESAARVGGESLTLRLADYERAGGLSGALQAHGDEVIESLESRLRPAVEHVFRALVDGLSPDSATRRPQSVRDIARSTSMTFADVAPIVERFRAHDCSFLRPGPEVALEAATVVDLSHESLIRQWPLLHGWVEREARSAHYWRRLSAAATLHERGEGNLLSGLELANLAEWWRSERPAPGWTERYSDDHAEVEAFLERSVAVAEAEEREAAQRERRRKRRLKVTLGVVSLAAVVASGTALWGWQQRRLADRNLELAMDTADELAISFVEKLRDDPTVPITTKSALLGDVEARFEGLLDLSSEDAPIAAKRVELLIGSAEALLHGRWSPEARTRVDEARAIVERARAVGEWVRHPSIESRLDVAAARIALIEGDVDRARALVDGLALSADEPIRSWADAGVLIDRYRISADIEFLKARSAAHVRELRRVREIHDEVLDRLGRPIAVQEDDGGRLSAASSASLSAWEADILAIRADRNTGGWERYDPQETLASIETEIDRFVKESGIETGHPTVRYLQSRRVHAARVIERDRNRDNERAFEHAAVEIDLLTELLAQDKDNARYRLDLASAYQSRAASSIELRRTVQARNDLQAAAALTFALKRRGHRFREATYLDSWNDFYGARLLIADEQDPHAPLDTMRARLAWLVDEAGYDVEMVSDMTVAYLWVSLSVTDESGDLPTLIELARRNLQDTNPETVAEEDLFDRLRMRQFLFTRLLQLPEEALSHKEFFTYVKTAVSEAERWGELAPSATAWKSNRSFALGELSERYATIDQHNLRRDKALAAAEAVLEYAAELETPLSELQNLLVYLEWATQAGEQSGKYGSLSAVLERLTAFERRHGLLAASGDSLESYVRPLVESLEAVEKEARADETSSQAPVRDTLTMLNGLLEAGSSEPVQLLTFVGPDLTSLEQPDSPASTSGADDSSRLGWSIEPIYPGPWQTLQNDELDAMLTRIDESGVLGGSRAGAVHSIRQTRLDFYEDGSLVELEILSAGGPILYSMLLVGEATYLLDGSSPPIHKANAETTLRLDTSSRAASYLRFFCTYISGAEGAFRLIDDRDDILWEPNATDEEKTLVEKEIRPLAVWRTDDESWTATATIQYSTAVFHAALTAQATGMVEMADDLPVAADLNIKPILFENGGRSNLQRSLELDRFRPERVGIEPVYSENDRLVAVATSLGSRGGGRPLSLLEREALFFLDDVDLAYDLIDTPETLSAVAGALLDAGLNARTTRKLLERGVADFPDHPDLRQILRRAEAAAGAAGTSAPVD